MSASTASGNGSAIPPLVLADPRCKVCQSDRRVEIDTMLREGHSQATVRRHFNGLLDCDFFTANNLSVHTRKHLFGPDPEDWMRKMARARKVLGDPNAIPSQPKPEDALRTVVEVGLRMIEAGVSIPETADVIRAVKELKRIDREGLLSTEADMLRQIKAFTTSVKNHVPEDMWETIWDEFQEILGTR